MGVFSCGVYAYRYMRVGLCGWVYSEVVQIIYVGGGVCTYGCTYWFVE